MKLVENKVVVEFTLEERDILANFIKHELLPDSMSEEVYNTLKQLGELLAPGWY